ncbi:MAG: hypothetical protein DRP08_01245 [Candidatus Aenigmatarchaeota archaeon]|nr:MAG: hypothetical protein DRP08_01245 [Candidatus Aenigmarchaeota archaeon]
MMTWAVAFLGNLQQMAFFDFVLPWLLAFAIMFGVLTKSNIFKEKNVNGLISLVIAFFLTNYTPYGTSLGAFFTTLSGSAILVLSGLLVVLLFAGLMGLKPEDILGGNKTALGLFLLIIGIILFISAGGESVIGVNLGGETLSALFMVLIIAIAVMFVTKGQ